MSNLSVEMLDVERFVKVNNLQEITNPVFFASNGAPTPDGLLSNEIFGITKDQRGGTCAYIDLGEWFIAPLYYKIWTKVDRKVRDCVHGTKKFSFTSKGELVEDENGKNGVELLRNNIMDIKFKDTSSDRTSRNIKFLNNNRDKAFIRKQIIIPAYYRDVNTNAGKIGVGDINKLYSSLLIAIKAIRETKDYGLNLSAASRGRAQEILLGIYQWFADEPNLSKKFGIMRRSVMSKTTDYASRLVLSAPNLNVETMEDMQVDLDHSMVPLASIIVNFYPYILFHVRRFFENEFTGKTTYDHQDLKSNKIISSEIEDYRITFSDDEIKKQMDRFIHGYSNRLIPIVVPLKGGKVVPMRFKGYLVSKEDYEKSQGEVDGKFPIMERELTWCDVLYIAAVEATRDKLVLLTRYPIDQYFNQFPTNVVVSSTKETEPMVINNTFYKHYPKIRQADIGSNTSSSFVDTMIMSNLHLESIGGDYDGDQVNVKGIYTQEANEELKKFKDSKAYYISLGGKNVRTPSKDAIQALYSLTITLPSNKLTNPIF